MQSDNTPDPYPGLTPLWTPEQISEHVAGLAGEIDRDYAANPPVLVGALKGAFVFLADLARQIQTPVEIEFMRLSSYDSGRYSSGYVRVAWGPARDAIEGRPVIVVEDILDTGLTTSVALRHLRRKRPSSLSVCTLLDRPERRTVDVKADYAGFTFSGHFVVGYGLDLDQQYRDLPGIYALDADE
ncbi:MAG: hypoxanthine phosphoribosyltransferase [Dehalococcoidia bacterium]|jgi:hypoxanthine phosphoribosyltransferase|nr:hypoxanthine phosphoribosyltransferase [Dehalococcoidia bacterium]